MKGHGAIERHRGRWTARFRFTDPVTGKRREIRRCAATKAEAGDLLEEIRRAVRGSGGTTRVFEGLTFRELADYYERLYVQQPTYAGGRRVAGLRSFQTVRGYVARLRDHFGDRELRAITYGDIREFRLALFSTPTRRKEQRSAAHVNRVLATLRRMLNVARRERWILESPFEAGDPLVIVADERSRERILTLEEERRLLAACDHPRRLHLRALIVAALDTGCRRGELLKLQWKDVDFAGQRITVQGFHTKTMRTRMVPMTARLAAELRALPRLDARPEAPVFGVTTTVKSSFATALKLAGIGDLRFHDLRHTAATRLARGHLPLAEVGRILGHSEPKTTFRYVNSDDDTLRRATEIFEEYQTHATAAEESERADVN